MKNLCVLRGITVNRMDVRKFFVEKHLRTAVAKLETDDDLTEKETVAGAIAAGCLINECSEEDGQLRITTEPIGVVKCGDKFRVFTQHETLFGEE